MSHRNGTRSNAANNPARGNDRRCSADLARVHVDTWRTAYRGIVPDHYLAALSYEQRTEVWRRNLQGSRPDPGVFVAEDESIGITGFAGCGQERSGDPIYTGELYAIYVLAGYQGQGIGHRLMRAASEHLIAQGMRAMLLWALAENPSRRFYETIGGRYLRDQPIEIDGVTLQEVAYGWDDLERFVESLRARETPAEAERR